MNASVLDSNKVLVNHRLNKFDNKKKVIVVGGGLLGLTISY